MPTLTPAQKADIEAADNQVVEEPEEVEVETDADPEESEEEVEQEDDLSEQELTEARNLYKALKDPGTRSLVLNDLAKAAGITSDSTKKEVKEAKKGIEQILKETLGEGYNFMIPTLSKALEQILESEKEERNAGTKRVEAQVVQQQVDRALDRLARETKGDSRKVEARMVQLMNQFQASPDTDIYTYLNGIYNIATAGRSNKVATQKITEKINKNSKDAFARLPSARGTQQPSGKLPDKKMNLNQSIKWAMDQMEKG